MGAPDFFFAVNATFRHILDSYGEEALHRYWEEMGREHYRSVTEGIQRRGLQALREHWETLFLDEPGSEIEIDLTGDLLTLRVQVCPAILHLRQHRRAITPVYCDHCRYVSKGMCDPAGVDVEIVGGGGACVQTFRCGPASA